MKMKGSEKYAAGSSNRSDRPCRKSDSDSYKEVKEEVERGWVRCRYLYGSLIAAVNTIFEVLG